MVGGEEGFPVFCCFVVAFESFFLRTFEYGNVKVLGVNLKYIYQVAVGPFDRLFLEVVAETPVTQHLEHGVVVGVVAYFLEVVVLARYAQTLLRVALAAALGFGIAEDDVLELIHTSVGKHQRGVVLDNHRS